MRQQVETVEQMRALPYGTILRELRNDTLWYVHDEGAYELGWTEMGSVVRFQGYDGEPGDADMALPAEVLYRPDEAEKGIFPVQLTGDQLKDILSCPGENFQGHKLS